MPYRNRQDRLEYAKKYRRENAEQLEAHRKKWLSELSPAELEDFKRKRNESKSAWDKRNKKKVCAHAMVHYYVRKGILKKELCHCGSPAEAHHDDYSKPLEVRWLCHKHHIQGHFQE